MKKLIFGLVLCLSMAIVAQAISITVENNGFEEPGTEKKRNWEEVLDWSSDTVAASSGVEENPYVGNWNGYVMAGISPDYTNPDPSVWQLTNHTIATGEEVITLAVVARIGWMSTGNEGAVLGDTATYRMTIYYDNGGTRVVAKTQDVVMTTTIDTGWNGLRSEWIDYTLELDVDVDCPAAVGHDIGIEFYGVSYTGSNGCWIAMDDVRLTIADFAYNPDPCDMEQNVAATTNLEWELAPAVTNCDVFFGSDPNFINNPKVVGAENVEIYDPPADLADETTYYWRVDARVGTTVYEGDIWEFTTITADPVIDEDPCGLTVDAGETAVFRVKATNVDSYLWKRANGAAIPDNTGATLTITDVQKANEDVYWCELTNAATTIETAKVNLMTRRLVARWEFEDTLADSEADGWDGAYTDPNLANDPPDPCYVLDPDSIDGGKALQLSDDVLHVQITDSEDFFNFYPQGYTLNAWVKTVQDADYGCMTSKQDRNDYPNIEGWVLNCTNTGVAAHGLRQVFGSGAGASVVGTSNIADNQWHMVTATYNAETGTGTIYVDGLLENQLVDTVRKAPTNGYPMILGAETVSGSSSYAGLLDKASIYSYSLSQVEVAVLYTDVTGGNLCVGGNPEYDLNNDCQVDLEDFALLATSWMECNLVPDCMP